MPLHKAIAKPRSRKIDFKFVLSYVFGWPINNVNNNKKKNPAKCHRRWVASFIQNHLRNSDYNSSYFSFFITLLMYKSRT